MFPGYWRMLDFDYISSVLNRILSFVEENSWSFEAVPLKPTLDDLEDLELREILQHCMDSFGEKICQSQNEGRAQLGKLKFLAVLIL